MKFKLRLFDLFKMEQYTKQEILEMYPYLEAGDIDEENEEGSIMNDEKYEEALSSPLLLTF